MPFGINLDMPAEVLHSSAILMRCLSVTPQDNTDLLVNPILDQPGSNLGICSRIELALNREKIGT